MKSLHFDFLDWKDAFGAYDMAVVSYGTDKVQFVVSQHPYTSGYWVENKGCECAVGDVVCPHEHVVLYRCQVQREVENARKEGRIPRFIPYNPNDFKPKKEVQQNG